MYRKGSYIASRIVGLVVILAVSCIFAIQIPQVQTGLSQRILSKVTAALEGKISYDELHISPSGVLILKGVSVTDDNPTTPPDGTLFSEADTLFYAETVSATFSVKSLLKKEGINVGRLDIKNACFHLVTEPEGKMTNLEKIFGLERKGLRPEPSGDVFDVRKVVIDNLHFVFNNHKKALTDTDDEDSCTVDFTDIDLRADLEAHSLKYTGSRLYASVDDFSLTEKSGYTVEHLSGSCAVGQGLTVVEDLDLRDGPDSEVKLDRFDMSYDKPLSRSEFVEDVFLKVKGLSSDVSLTSLWYLLGAAIPRSTEHLRLSVETAEGCVNDLSFNNLNLSARDGGISAVASGSVSGVASPQGSLALDATLKDCLFNTKDVSSLLSLWSDKAAAQIRTIAPETVFSLCATAKGTTDNMNINGQLSTQDSGSVEVNAKVANITKNLVAKLELSTDGLRLDTFTGNNNLGECDLFAEASVETNRKRFSRFSLDSLNIGSFQAFGYTYSGISGGGEYDGKTLDAVLNGADPNLKFDIKVFADVTSSSQGRRFKILGDIDNADLYALGIDTRRSVSRVSFGVDGDFVLKDDVIDGSMTVDSLRLENPDGVKNIGDVHFLADGDEPVRHYSMEAPFAEFDFSGTSSVSDFITILNDVTLRKELPSLFAEQKTPLKGEKYNVDLILYDTRDIFSFAFPGMYISEDSSLHLSVDEDGFVKGAASVPRLAFGKNYLKNAVILLDNLGNSINLSLDGSEVSAWNFEITEPSVGITGADDNISLAVNFNGYTGSEGSGDIYMDMRLRRDEENELVINAHPLESFVTVGSDIWRFGESEITIKGKEIAVKDFDISSGSQRLKLSGMYGSEQEDTLRLALENLDLSVVNEFLAQEYGFDGMADGDAVLISENGDVSELTADLVLDSVRVGESFLGKFSLSAYLEDGRDDMVLYARNETGGVNTLNASASYFIDDGRMDVGAVLDKFPVAVAEPFLKDIFADVGGNVSGKVRVQGQEDRLSIFSDGLYLNDILLRPSYTGVLYTINGPLRVDNDGVYFDTVNISDDSGGTGLLNGTMHHDHLSKFSMDSRLEFKSLKVIDAVAKSKESDEGSGVYGLLRASGRADITGPFNALNINADVSTTGDGNIHIPTNGSSFGGSSGLLTFVSEETPTDPYEEMLSTLAASVNEEKASDMNIRARVTAHPGVTAYIELDKSSGNMASFNGEGAVDVHLRPSKAVFDVNGNYNISEGNYRFAVPGILSKDFSIQNGSSIKFGGDILNSELDINAIYSLHTSLKAIVTDSSSVATRRLVECGIGISGGIRDPQINLSINVPDLDPNTKVQVNNALNTEDKMQKQFLALLLIGSFIPDESSGVVNSTNIVLSNVTEVVSSQFNSILRKLEIPVDVGVSYLGSYQGTNMFDVAISTQLFNNRVIVSGTAGNRKGITSGSSNGDIVGDLDVEIKMDPEGRYRFSIFSHSADQYTNYLDYSQRNGVGISFQKEYDNFSEMLQSIFRPKAYREALQKENDKPKEERIIKIENEE